MQTTTTIKNLIKRAHEAIQKHESTLPSVTTVFVRSAKEECEVKAKEWPPYKYVAIIRLYEPGKNGKYE